MFLLFPPIQALVLGGGGDTAKQHAKRESLWILTLGGRFPHKSCVTPCPLYMVKNSPLNSLTLLSELAQKRGKIGPSVAKKRIRGISCENEWWDPHICVSILLVESGTLHL